MVSLNGKVIVSLLCVDGKSSVPQFSGFVHRPQVTFDLLGSDHLVLSQLLSTLGLLMHLAMHAPVSTQTTTLHTYTLLH